MDCISGGGGVSWSRTTPRREPLGLLDSIAFENGASCGERVGDRRAEGDAPARGGGPSSGSVFGELDGGFWRSGPGPSSREATCRRGLSFFTGAGGGEDTVDDRPGFRTPEQRLWAASITSTASVARKTRSDLRGLMGHVRRRGVPVGSPAARSGRIRTSMDRTRSKWKRQLPLSLGLPSTRLGRSFRERNRVHR